MDIVLVEVVKVSTIRSLIALFTLAEHFDYDSVYLAKQYYDITHLVLYLREQIIAWSRTFPPQVGGHRFQSFSLDRIDLSLHFLLPNTFL